MTGRAKSLQVADRVVLEYVVQGDTAGVPLLLLHGYMDSWCSFEPLLRHLPPYVRALAVTQRGHGDASRPATGYATTDFAADIEGFLDALELDAAVLVGGSSGGFAARRFALDHPERSMGLVLLGSPASLHDKANVREMWEREISKLSDPLDPAFVRAFQAGSTVETVPAAFLESMVRESLKVPARIWRAVLEGLLEDESVDELGEIDVPTLIVWGENDPIVPREDQDRMAAAIADSHLVVIPGVSHALYWENPERVAGELSKFASGLVTAGP